MRFHRIVLVILVHHESHVRVELLVQLVLKHLQTTDADQLYFAERRMSNASFCFEGSVLIFKIAVILAKRMARRVPATRLQF